MRRGLYVGGLNILRMQAAIASTDMVKSAPT